VKAAVFPDPLATAMIPGQRTDTTPVSALIADTIAATRQRPTSRPARILFAELDQRGRDAWRQATVVMIQHTCAVSDLEPGPAGAATYLMRQDPLDDAMLCIAAVGKATAAYIRDLSAAAVLAALDEYPDGAVRDGARHLLCLAMTGKIRPEVLDQITGELLADVY
jgi:hypothetical protein